MKNKIIFKTLMLKGEAGSTIVSMEKTGHVGTADIYTITFNDGSTTEISLENMSAITSVEKTSSTDTEDIYTITCADGSTQNFSVLNHNADIAAIETQTANDIAEIDARVDNFINSVVPNTVETLWTGSIQHVGDSATLSKAVSNFDYIDLYLLGSADSKYIRVPATQTAVEIQQQNMSDNASSNFLRLWEMGVSISGTTVSITKLIAWAWDDPDNSNPTVTANAQNGNPITRIDGVKVASDTPAELTDIRVGANGVTYASAGDAVRNQFNDVNTIINDDIKARLTNVDGIVVPVMEIGTIAMSSTSIAFNSSTTAIRTPSTGGVRVSVGDVLKLTSYSGAKFKCCILKDSDSKYVYTSFQTTDYYVANDGVLYVVVAKSDDSAISQSDMVSLQSLVRVEKRAGAIFDINEKIKPICGYDDILENSTFPSEWFGTGDFDPTSGIHTPTVRTYRVSTLYPLLLDYDVYLTIDSLYRIALYEYINSTWTRRGGSSEWLNYAKITAGTEFAFCIAKVSEDTSPTADVDTFVSKVNVETNFSKSAKDIVNVNETAIQTFMSRFYESNQAEAYVFFTDPHLVGANGTFDVDTFKSYIDALSATVKRTSAPYVVCGGDWLTSGDTKAQASEKLGFVDGQMRSIFPDKYYPIVGNHDFNYLGVDGEGTRLTEANWISQNAMRNFWFHEYDNCYYKFKAMTAQNYVLNTRTDHEGTNAYDKTMLDWFAAQLIEDDATHATVMFHIYYLSTVVTSIPTRVQAIGAIISAFNSHTTCTLTNATHGYDKTYDFTNTTGHIDYVIVGHTHADFSDTFGGVPVVGCDNFTDGDTPTFDLVFADYSNNKLYLTRIGTGTSREINI